MTRVNVNERTLNSNIYFSDQGTNLQGQYLGYFLKGGGHDPNWYLVIKNEEFAEGLNTILRVKNSEKHPDFVLMTDKTYYDFVDQSTYEDKQPGESPVENDIPEAFGVWVVYYTDDSPFVIFRKEIDALRYAVENTMRVKFVQEGVVT